MNFIFKDDHAVIVNSCLQGVQPLLDGVLSYLPCPIEVSNYALDQSKKEEKVFQMCKEN